MRHEADESPGSSLRPMLLLALLATALFAQTVTYDFVWDDKILIERNSFIRFGRNIPTFFTSDYNTLSHQMIAQGYYRPLLALSFFLDYQAWGTNPAGFHLTNVLVHAAVTTLVFVFARQISGQPLIALLAGLVFAVHPIHVEAVAFVSARVDLWFTLGYLAAAIGFLGAARREGHGRWGFLLFSAAAYAFSLLHKETAVTLPLLLALIVVLGFTRTEDGGRRQFSALALLLPHFAVLTGYLAIRALHSPLRLSVGMTFTSLDLLLLLLTSVRTFARYLLIAILPLPPAPYYDGGPVKSLLDMQAGGAALLLAVAGLGLWWAKRHDRVVFLGGAWFFLTLLPAAYPIVISGGRHAIMADRYLYLPSVGLAIALASILHRLVWWAGIRYQTAAGTAAGFVLLAALGVCVPSTLYWSPIWRDDVDLYEHMVLMSPSSADPQLNLGATYSDLGRYEEARGPLGQAIRLDPNYGAAYTALGRVYEAEGKREEALIFFRGGFAATPNDFRTGSGLGLALLKRGNTEEAIPLLERVVQSNPYYSQAQNALGVAYLERGDQARALAQFEQARNLLPEAIGPRYNLALLYTDLNRFPEAIRELEAVLQIDPDYTPASRMLAAIEQHLRNGGAAPKVGQPHAESSPTSGGK